MSRTDDLDHIGAALDAAVAALAPFTPGAIEHQMKDGWDPVTAADEAVNAVLADILPLAGDGWLSEETADDAARLDCRRVWVVDPVDGTREFIQGIPEWCISIGLVEDGVAVAGGICNPSTGETILGSLESGVALNGVPVSAHPASRLEGVRVLASRSEVNRGEWECWHGAGFEVVPMGSVAYKMARVGAGLDPVTWTLVPKSEWDVAAGTALIAANGGAVFGLDGLPPSFNRAAPKLAGLVACAPGVEADVRRLLGL